MPHVSLNGVAKFVTPNIAKRGKDGKIVELNPLPGGASLALAIAYLFEVAAYTKETSNRLENKTARKAAVSALPAIKAGKPEDVMIYYMPAKISDAGVIEGWTPIMETTRAELIKTATLTAEADKVLSDAESKVAEIAKGLSKDVKQINPIPSYGATSGGGRGKRAGGLLEF